MIAEKIVSVAVFGTTYHFDTEYTYSLPQAFIGCVSPGSRVEVPFGRNNKRTAALVLSVSDMDETGDTAELKSVAAVLSESSLFTDELLLLVKYLKETTFCTYHEAAKCVLPAGIGLKMVASFSALPPDGKNFLSLSPAALEVYRYLQPQKRAVTRERLLKALKLDISSDAPEELVRKGFAVKSTNAVRKVGDSSVRCAELTGDAQTFEDMPKGLSQKQTGVMRLLFDLNGAPVKELCAYSGVTPAVVAALEKKGLLRTFDRAVPRRPKTPPQPITPVSEETISDELLSGEQTAAYETLSALRRTGTAKAALLYGVTGSGKTQVYLHLIDDALKDGKSVIVMVPEIALTPQSLAIFYARYGEKVAVFHSGLSAGERIDEWKRARNGEAKIALGTRSAVFAPFDDLGLIVMDEEQEHTYKSEMSPKYHARDVAKFRCAHNDALLLLCSATPSVESYKNALDGKYTLVTLNNRYGNSVLPLVTTVDSAHLQNGALSVELYDKLEACLNDKKQAILLINRRGFNTFASCSLCKKVALCPNCSISLTYHRVSDRLMCHYCGYTKPYTTKCVYCGGDGVRYYGSGTQRIEEELLRVFPEARLLRMDADTTGSRYVYEEKLTKFSAGEYDILVGTQMVAKGLDFPGVTLVGVISVDRELYNDDFRAAERTFDLLTQVVGRSGRRETQGEAVIQSVLPDNEIIALAAAQDYEAFFITENALRKTMLYPPYCDICTAMFISESEDEAQKGAVCFQKLFISAATGDFSGLPLKLLGPIMPRISKINNKYRFKFTIKCKNSKRFRQMMSSLIVEYMKNPKNKANITVDMNALD